MEEKKRKFPLALVLSIGIPIAVIATILIVLVAVLSDKNRNTREKVDAEYAEIVKKNIIKGFEHTSESGKFTFSLEEDDINSLLGGATKAINSKYVESIYYENKEEKHIFYVDLSGIPIKSRVALTTSIKESNDSKIYLCIDSIKVGKLNASNFVTKKLFQFSDKINSYFKDAHIPVSLDSENKAFVVDPFSYISTFPNDGTSGIFWEIIDENKDMVTINKDKLGLTIDFSPFRSSADLSVKDYGAVDLPNFYDDLKTKTVSEFEAVSTPGDITVYKISEDEFNHLLQKSLPTNKREEIKSSLTDKIAVFNLVGTKTTFLPGDMIDVGTIYSLNGYLVDAHFKLEFVDESDRIVKAGMYVTNDNVNHPIVLGSSRKVSANASSNLKSALTKTLEKTEENQSEQLFTWNASNLALVIDLTTMNSGFPTLIQDANKSLVLNNVEKTLDFIVEK